MLKDRNLDRISALIALIVLAVIFGILSADRSDSHAVATEEVTHDSRDIFVSFMRSP